MGFFLFPNCISSSHINCHHRFRFRVAFSNCDHRIRFSFSFFDCDHRFCFSFSFSDCVHRMSCYDSWFNCVHLAGRGVARSDCNHLLSFIGVHWRCVDDSNCYMSMKRGSFLLLRVTIAIIVYVAWVRMVNMYRQVGEVCAKGLQLLSVLIGCAWKLQLS